MELTSPGFWDDYWKGCPLPARVDMSRSFDRCLGRALKARMAGCAGAALEVGCAPGKWLAFLARELGLTPSGIEYSHAGVELTERNLRMQGIEAGEIIEGDFFAIEPAERFDAVISLGFIEHFNDSATVARRHLEWLKPGGTLVLGVPNFRGIHGLFQSVLDSSLLEKHNRAVMEPGFFRQFAAAQGLDVRFAGYLGSLEPDLPVHPPRGRSAPQLLVKAALRLCRALRRTPLLDGWNSPFVSSYLLAVLTRGQR